MMTGPADISQLDWKFRIWHPVIVFMRRENVYYGLQTLHIFDGSQNTGPLNLHYGVAGAIDHTGGPASPRSGVYG